MCERNGTANTYNKYLLMLTYFFLFSTSINEYYNAHKRYIFFYSPGFIAQKTYFEFSQFSKIGNLLDMYTRNYSIFEKETGNKT